MNVMSITGFHQVSLMDREIFQLDDVRTAFAMLPAGAIEAGEGPLIAAKRELLEEAEYAAARWDNLGAFSVNGNYGCGRARLFVAGDAKRVKDPCSEDLEETEILEMGHDELTEAVYSGEIKVLAVAALICMVNLRRRREASEG